MKRKSLSLLEAVMTDNSEAFFHLLMIQEPGHSQIEDFNHILGSWEELQSTSPSGLDECIDEFVKLILQNKTLNEEICKLVIYLTSKSL